MKKWFTDTLAFSCTSCGKCCKSKGSNKVFLNLAESQAIAKHIGIDVPAFHSQYTDHRLNSENRPFKSIKQHENKKQCTFLEGNKCTIYEVRPTQCRTYPFWPQNMIGPAEWIAEAHLCEGIQVTKSLESADAIRPFSNSPSKAQCGVDDNEIALNMLTHQIHDRGRGENWTYEETVDLLNLTKEESSTLLDDYLDSFFDSNESRIEYESPLLRVVDSRSVDHSTEGGEGEGEGEMSKYSRRMEFVSSPQLAQTEISFAVDGEEWQRHALRTNASPPRTISPVFDYNSLQMPVHQVMFTVAEKILRHRGQRTSSSSSSSSTPSSVAVIGAGCCALPAKLLSSFPSTLTVHAVEPALEVLHVADSLFGMDQFPTERLVRHALDGAAFIREHPDARFDVIIIDAFESAPSEVLEKEGLRQEEAASAPGDGEVVSDIKADGDGVPAVLAPPFSMLDHWQQWAHALRPPRDASVGALGGLLVVNVFGPTAWVELVQARMERSGLFSPVLRLETASLAELQGLSKTDSRNVVLSSMLICDADFFSRNVTT